MTTEPIRLPAIAWGLLVVVLAIVIAVVLDVDIERAIGIVFAAIATAGGVVALAESKRARTDSPATIERRLAGLASTPLPEDERDHG